MIVRSINEIEAGWDNFSSYYTEQDNQPNVFYLSLLNMLKVEKRNNILEVGAGGGYLYHHMLNRKKREAKYTATDLSENMLKIMCKRLNIEYGSSQQTVVDKYNLVIKKANGEQLPFADNSFDCYIANLCLQITTDPIKMLSESYRVLEKGGVAGFSVWGDKDISSFFTFIPNILNEFGIKQPTSVRSNFHLNDRVKLIKMMEDAGYTNVICWNQFSPFQGTTEEEILKHLDINDNYQIASQGEEQSNKIKNKIVQKVRELLNQKHHPLGIDALIVIGVKN